jgi:hypothetical protein
MAEIPFSSGSGSLLERIASALRVHGEAEARRTEAAEGGMRGGVSTALVARVKEKEGRPCRKAVGLGNVPENVPMAREDHRKPGHARGDDLGKPLDKPMFSL